MKFELTKDHIKLAQKMYVGWQDCEFGAPEIDPKRPYGNSYVEGDIAEILGWKLDGEGPDDDDLPCLSTKQKNNADKLHQEMEIALQIILCCKTFKPGIFEKQDQYDALSWKRI